MAQEFIAGETLHGLAARHGVSRNLIRVWVMTFEAGAFDEDAEAAGLLQEYEAKIAALERMVGRQVGRDLGRLARARGAAQGRRLTRRSAGAAV